MSALLPKFLSKTKLALLFAICFLLFAVSSKPIHAFAPDTDYFQFEQAVFKTEEMNLESFVFANLNNLVNSLIGKIFGCISCREGKPLFGERPDGAVGSLAFLIATPYSYQPASGIDYLAYLEKKINPAQPAYAQGLGFEEMKPLMDIWKIFRDISYVFFVIAFVFLGFAIMFRVKISPQAVLTIQSALPRIVMALILVTFSYAIVGFLIDIVWIINNILLNIFGKLFYDLGGVFQPGKGILTEPGLTTSAGLLFFRMFGITLLPTVLAFLTFMLTTIIITIILAAVSIPAGGVAGWIAIGISGVIILLYAIILLIALLRALWTLIKAYANIILALIFAPFAILIGVMPGSNAINSWFRNLIANLAVLPTVLVMVLISSYLICATWAKYWIYLGLGGVFPVITQLIAAFTGKLSAEQQMQIFILITAGTAILLMTPKAADMIQAFLAGKPFGYGAAIGEAMGPIVVPAQWAQRTITGGISREVGRKVGEPIVGLASDIPGAIKERRLPQIPPEEPVKQTR